MIIALPSKGALNSWKQAFPFGGTVLDNIILVI